MATFTATSEEFTNRSQSWCFEGIYRNSSTLARVTVRSNAYDDQSHAKVEVWNQHGWSHFTSLPTEKWYPSMPSYTKKALDGEDHKKFLNVRDLLLSKLAFGLYGDYEVALRQAA
jgi:hypothetical protein